MILNLSWGAVHGWNPWLALKILILGHGLGQMPSTPALVSGVMRGVTLQIKLRLQTVPGIFFKSQSKCQYMVSTPPGF